ncbi:hypothetical protein BC832DRAFT_595685 [Gaertneriomyces semiglobifer]|nr:hypothetical protein BC832DRAFT_595685 [Gaertneriomyces semiglobifer]
MPSERDLTNDQVAASAQLAFQSLRTTAHTVTSHLTLLTSHSLTLVQTYIQRYPSLQTFLYTTAILSALPVGCFAVWVALSTAATVFIAALSAFVVESGLIAIGFTVLLPVECVILSIAGGAALLTASQPLRQTIMRRSQLVLTDLNDRALQLHKSAQRRLRKELNGLKADATLVEDDVD